MMSGSRRKNQPAAVMAYAGVGLLGILPNEFVVKSPMGSGYQTNRTGKVDSSFWPESMKA